MKQDVEQIKQYYDTLNADLSHFHNTNDICTPIDCVQEMVDSVPEEFWHKKDLKILDCCCGNGNFHSYISLKTPLKNLYFNEINDKRIRNLYNYFGDKINFTNKDFLEFEDREVYDMVVANPPYARFTDNKRTAKNHNLSRSFIEKALRVTKEGGYLLFIVPNNWMSFSDRNSLPKQLSSYQFLQLNIGGAKKYFPKVGSSFTWFLLHKKPNKSTAHITNTYVIKSEVDAVIDKGVNFIPLYYDDVTRGIVNKVVTLDNPVYPTFWSV